MKLNLSFPDASSESAIILVAIFQAGEDQFFWFWFGKRNSRKKEIKIIFSWDNQMYQSLSKTAGEGYKVSVVFNGVEA